MIRAGAYPTNGISMEFQIWSTFSVLRFKMCPTDHDEHFTTVLQSWHVQNFFVVGWICYEQEHYKNFIEFQIQSKYRLWNGRQVTNLLMSHHLS